MNILSIETSCDETAIALLEARGSAKTPKIKILANEVSSQIPVHRPYGGVVPMLAKREHIKNLPIVLAKALRNAKFIDSKVIAGNRVKKQSQIKGLPRVSEAEPLAMTLRKKIDLIAVTIGPGLEPALWTGIEFAKRLSKQWKVPVVGTSHLEGHLYSFLLPQKRSDKRHETSDMFPAIALVVSGGHTILAVMESLTQRKRIGETIDDAAGEAFDKVARMMNLPYPGGAEIEMLAKRGNPAAISFPRPMIHTQNFNFSFSGLKTAVLYYLRDHIRTSKEDVCAGFQAAVCDTLAMKVAKAVKQFGCKTVILSGGVASNKHLQKTLNTHLKSLKVKLITSQHRFNTDNASMIGVAGYMAFLKKKKRPLKANSHINL